jgi:hypothetical protein
VGDREMESSRGGGRDGGSGLVFSFCNKRLKHGRVSIRIYTNGPTCTLVSRDIERCLSCTLVMSRAGLRCVLHRVPRISRLIAWL